MTPVYNFISQIKHVIRTRGLRAAMAIYSAILSITDLRFYMRAAYL